MKKILATLLLGQLSIFSYAATISTSEGKITRIHTYDDYLDGTVYIYIDMPIAACPKGSYLNATSPGFERLYSAALAAMMANKKVIFQLYDERVIQERCEVDAIQIIAN